VFNLSKYSKTLELDKILKLLSDEASMDDAKEKAVSLSASNDYDTVKILLKQTDDAYVLMARYSAPAFGNINGINSILARSEAGGILTMKELLKVSETLRIIRSVKNWRENCNSENETALDEFFNGLYPNRYFEDKILFCIKSEDEMSDNASPALSEIRRKIKSTSANVRNRFDKIIKDGAKSKFLQEAIVTQRDGRYVVPVKSEYKNDVPGIVHDTSSSGATLFIEPMIIVELNNELRVLETKEKLEIERILSDLSTETSQFANTIRSSYMMLVDLNLIFAKASLAYKMKATLPNINKEGKIYLKNARHPLIDKKKIVPITVELGKEYNSLIITGPNTGGKTVTLKTVGLLTLMTMCGLLIPVDSNSEVCVFDRILVDIGDEQSIELSLSTFSSHMVNIIKIIDSANENSLILLDELGGGTDPVEGAALARAILYKLHLLGSKIIATTHYSELKAYALDTNGVQNACFEFDVDTLKPTYKLMVGIPGKSNAFAIAGALGMSSDIIRDAKSGINEESRRFEKVAALLEETRKEIDAEKQEAARIRLELAKEKERVDSHLAEIEKKKELIISKSREDATRILDNARNQSNMLLNSLEELKKEFNANNANERILKAKQLAKKGVNDIENLVDPVDNNSDDQYVLPRIPVVGDVVLITTLNKKGNVTKVDEKNKKVFVSAGNLTLWVDFQAIKLSANDKKTIEGKKTRNVSGLKSRAERTINGEVDIRGMDKMEGIMVVDRYIDEAILSGIDVVTVIHGKGTGVLRDAVHSHFRKHPNIESFRVGTFGEGENGVTIATLKK